MTSLRETQRRICHAFYSGDAEDVIPLLAGDSIPCDVQVQIYNNNARQTFHKTLASSYPVVERLVGEACFRGLCSEYLRRYPSSSGSLQRFGADFCTLLADLFASTEYGYLPAIARLEWACEQVLAGPEFRVTELKNLVDAPPAALSSWEFGFQNEIRVIESDYPILTIWRANQPGQSAAIDLSTGAEYVAVFRRGGDAVLRLVLPGVSQIIRSLQEGMTFLDACESAVESEDRCELVRVLGSLITLSA